MKTINFDTEHAKKLELAISVEFSCRTSEIVSLRDALVKKVIVFILSKTKDYNPHVLAANYQISYLYIPTIIAEIEYLIRTVPAFENKIKTVCKNLNIDLYDNIAVRKNGNNNNF
jgi:hypothetical protein